LQRIIMSLSESDSKSLELLHATLNGGVLSNNAPLVQVFAGKTAAEITPIREAYHEIKHGQLETAIKKKLSGDFEYAILSIATIPAVYDAQTIRTATKGLGTDEVTLIEILGTRSPAEIEAINTEYKNTDSKGTELLALINSELGGKLRDAFRLVLAERKALDADLIADHVAALYRAGEGKMGTDEKTFINIIAGYEREHVLAVADAYEKKHGKSLETVIKSEFSRDLEKFLLALATPVHVFLAHKIKTALTKMNVDEKVITRIVITQREANLTKISSFLNSDGKPNQRKPLAQWVTEKTGGNLKTFLNSVCANFVENERS